MNRYVARVANRPYVKLSVKYAGIKGLDSYKEDNCKYPKIIGFYEQYF